jgi:DNA-binding transcriptional regulator of glucitol operon
MLFRAPAPKAGAYTVSPRPQRADRTALASTSSPTTARPRWRASTNSSGPDSERYGQVMSTTRRRRPALIILVIVAACGCLALGSWQWTRFQSASGTFQNLGYALQWPLFAWFCVYAYRKFVRYEQEPPQTRHDGALTEIPAGLLPERPEPVHQPPDDPALREYNAYLAELAKKDAAKENRTTA